MNKIITELLGAWAKGKIGHGQFFEQFHSKTGITLDQQYCLQQIKKAILENDAETLEIFIEVGFMFPLNAEWIPVWCELLTNPNHYNHENIASQFQRLKDATTVESLYNAAEMEFEYLNYDDGHVFASKCIKALAAIGNDNAIEKLKLLAGSKIKDISDYAKKELQYKGLL